MALTRLYVYGVAVLCSAFLLLSVPAVHETVNATQPQASRHSPSRSLAALHPSMRLDNSSCRHAPDCPRCPTLSGNNQSICRQLYAAAQLEHQSLIHLVKAARQVEAVHNFTALPILLAERYGINASEIDILDLSDAWEWHFEERWELRQLWKWSNMWAPLTQEAFQLAKNHLDEVRQAFDAATTSRELMENKTGVTVHDCSLPVLHSTFTEPIPDSHVVPVIDRSRSMPAMPRVDLLPRLDVTEYVGAVTVSFLLQYFRSPATIDELVNALYDCTNGRRAVGQLNSDILFANVTSELLVNADNLDEIIQWRDAANRTAGFITLVFSDNVHEVRAYNKLAKIARGEYIVVLQDDEIPRDCIWVAEILKAFGQWPQAGLVGLREGTVRLHGRVGKTPVERFEPVTGLKVQFATAVDVGPIAARRLAFLSIGGFNEMLSKPGEGAPFLDYELCFRMWINGHHVLHLAPSGSGMMQVGGHKAWGAHSTYQNWWANGDYLDVAYGSVLQAIGDKVEGLNSQLLQTSAPKA